MVRLKTFLLITNMKGSHIEQLCKGCEEVKKHYIRPARDGRKPCPEQYCIHCMSVIKAHTKAGKDNCWEGYNDCAAFNELARMMCR